VKRNRSRVDAVTQMTTAAVIICALLHAPETNRATPFAVAAAVVHSR